MFEKLSSNLVTDDDDDEQLFAELAKNEILRHWKINAPLFSRTQR